MKKSEKKELSKALGDASAEEVIKLTSNYDKYILKFKSAMNKLLEPAGYEVKVGIAFVKKESSK